MLKKILEEISYIPSVTYLTQPINKYIIEKVKSFDIKKEDFASDEYGVYVRIKNGEKKRKTIIVSHLDHPGFVIGRNNIGIPFGDIGNHIIQKLLEKEPVSIKIFDSRGHFFCDGKIVSYLKNSKSPRVLIDADKNIPVNSFGQFDISRFEEKDGKINMYHADNNALTASALMALYSLKNTDDINVEFVFTHAEEVRQLGSLGIAYRKSTPFGVIQEDDIIINLEVITFLESEQGREEQKEIIRRKSSELGIQELSYDKGCVIRVNDTYCVYGLFFPSKINDAEKIVKSAFIECGAVFQTGIALGLTDASSFSLFPLTPHIVTLCMPSRYRHNWSDENQLCPESFFLHDAQTITNVLARMCVHVNTDFSDDLSVSSKLKLSGYLMDEKIVYKERHKRLKMLISLFPRMKKGHYFPENTMEKITFFLYKCRSKLYFSNSKPRLK